MTGIALSLLALILCVVPAAAQVDLPEASQNEAILATAQAANCWQQGAYEVWILRGDCRIVQGRDVTQSAEAVLWIDRGEGGNAASGQTSAFLAPGSAGNTADPWTNQANTGGGLVWQNGDPSSATTVGQRTKVIAFLEGGVTRELNRPTGPVRLTDQSWFGRFYTVRSVQVQAAVVAPKPDVLPGVYQRGMERRNPATADVVRRTGIEPAQFLNPQTPAPPPAAPSKSWSATTQAGPPIGQPLPPGTRRVRVFPRGDVAVQAQWFPDPHSNQWIAVIDSGVNLIVDGVSAAGTIDVSTDRMVIWTAAMKEPDLSGGTPQDQNTPMEIYMEGNIVFRQGDRLIYANRMYYDVRNQVGTVLDAEVLTPAPQYDGLLRLHARVVEQVGRDRFIAQDAFLTSSRLGVPRYKIGSGQITYEDNQQPVIDPYSGQQAVDPVTGKPLITHDQLATANNNFLYLEDIPVFYWPVIATDLQEPSYYLRRIRFKNDSVFGTQILTNWSMYQLLGIKKKPEGTDWDLSLDYLSKRGFGHGMTFLYHRDNLFNIPGKTAGLADYYGIFDNGNDNLGIDRPNLKPDVDYRYRFLWQHREELADGFQLTAEVGKQSDRHFLQEYFKREWDELKDQTTDVELRRINENTSWNIFAQARLDDFYTETQWLPRFDHFWLGEGLFNDYLTWYEHTSLAYAQFRELTPPTNPADVPFSFLPWEAGGNQQGERLITRQEIDLPVQVGAVKVVPYLLGELGRWGEAADGEPLNRAYYQAGIRASLPMWKVDSEVESLLWNVHGLAHKIEFDVEFWHSHSNQNLTDLPLYDPLDDNQIEDFRRRLRVYDFNNPAMFIGPPFTVAPIPPQFDERSYALRYGMAGWVTSPSMEIADDLTAIRAGVHQRWQTKRGMPDNRHIIDWIVLDSNVTFFPNPDRDNFGEVVGLWDYYFRWHVGDRLTFLSEGVFDFFDQGQKVVSVGAFLTRPPRGSLYAGVRIIEGPISNEVLSFSYSYWMSPKWVSSLGLNIDLGDNKNISEVLRITRIGESLLVSGGFSVDPARNSVGAQFTVEPRIFKGQLNQLGGGARIPPAGAFGLE